MKIYIWISMTVRLIEIIKMYKRAKQEITKIVVFMILVREANLQGLSGKEKHMKFKL